MKRITIALSLAFVAQAALGQDLATPTPTAAPAVYLGRHGQAVIARRAERRSERQSAAQAKAESRAGRVATATAEAQARQAARAREQAQREVAAQNLSQTRDEKPSLTSDLMARMGFSEQQIAVQKAREQSASSAGKENTGKPSLSP